MRRLILFRHAKTEPKPPGKRDIERQLTARGRHDAEMMGRMLAEAGLAPDLALVSPSARTRETWALTGAAFPETETQVRDALYEAAPEEVQAEIDLAAGDADTIIVVGHNPSLQELAVDLLIGGGASHADIERLMAGLPTATAVAFQIDAHGRARFDGLFRPKDYASDHDWAGEAP